MLLVVLWVRSYWYRESLSGWFPVHGFLQITGTKGVLTLIANGETWKPGFRLSAEELQEQDELQWNFHFLRPPQLNPRLGGWWIEINTPCWFLFLVCLTFGGIPWLLWFPWSKRFSLRTLLIATTLVAVVLGLVVWLVR